MTFPPEGPSTASMRRDRKRIEPAEARTAWRHQGARQASARWHHSCSPFGMPVESVNPATGRVIARYERHAPGELERRLQQTADEQDRKSVVEGKGGGVGGGGVS